MSFYTKLSFYQTIVLFAIFFGYVCVAPIKKQTFLDVKLTTLMQTLSNTQYFEVVKCKMTEALQISAAVLKKYRFFN